MSLNVFIIIPAYNEASVIGDVIDGLLPLAHTIVVVDDGSKDETAKAARRHGAVVLSHCTNIGQGAALQTGIEYARLCNADVVVTFDADGQHQPVDIPVLLNALERKNVDVVLGSRFLGAAHGLRRFRKMLLKLMVQYTNITAGMRLTDAHNGLRALRMATTGRISIKQNRMAHASELLQQIAKYKLRYVEVPCTIIYTPYSLAKGQKLSNSINILADLFLRRLHK